MEGVDYTLDERGRFVFTEHYNRRRGFCCFQGCRHCPWGQAGKGPAEAQAALRERLKALQRRAARIRPPVAVQGYRNGVLFVRTAGPGSAGDRAHAEPPLRKAARPLLTVIEVEWI